MALKKIKIDKIYHNDSKKDGSAYKDKNGKPFKLVTIYTKDKEGKDARLTYCDYKGVTEEWKEGEEVTVEITKNGEYLNFSPPSKLDLLEEEVGKLKARVEQLEKGGVQTTAKQEEAPAPTENKAVDDFEEWANTPPSNDVDF